MFVCICVCLCVSVFVPVCSASVCVCVRVVGESHYPKIIKPINQFLSCRAFIAIIDKKPKQQKKLYIFPKLFWYFLPIIY